LANCKQGSKTWCHFVHIKVLHMTSYSKFGIFEISWIKILKNSLKKVRNGQNFGYIQARELHLYHFVRIGVLHLTSYSKFGILNFFWMKILKNSLKKSGIAITLATYKLESCIWYHFVRIGVLHLTSYSKFGIFEITGIKIGFWNFLE
jgi:hypothetical protein